MRTIYDWASMAAFCVLAVLFLQRSAGPVRAGDTIPRYLPPAIGCALADYAGNHGAGIVAWALLAAVAGYIALVLRPFSRAG